MLEAEKSFFMLGQRIGSEMVEVAVYPGTAALALVIFVGQGGTVEGYRNKYQIIASELVEKYGAHVFIVENQQALDEDPTAYIQGAMAFVEETMVCFGFQSWECFAMGMSAGASFLASCIQDLAQVSRLLLINPVLSLDFKRLTANLADFQGELTLIQGSEDGERSLYPLIKEALQGEKKKILTFEGANHYFSHP